MHKIMVITSAFPRYQGDLAGNFVYELANKVSEGGVEVCVLAPHDLNLKLEENMSGLKVYRFPYFYPHRFQKLAYGGGISYNLKSSHLAKIQVPLFFLSELFYAAKLVKKERIDIIHSHWLVPQGLVGAICRKIFGIPHVMTVHAAGVFVLKRLPLKQKIADFIGKNCDKIIVVSSYIGETFLYLISPELKKEIEKKMLILPMGVHVQSFQNTNNKTKLLSEYKINSKFSLLFLGRLSDKKGIFYLIKAMPHVMSRMNDVNLIICGDGPLREELEQYVKDMKLENCVRFAGFISDEEKSDYLSLADVLIVPSIVLQSGETEGLPVVLLEGLAAGKPIVASDVSGVKDVIKNGWNGFLVEQKNPEQIAEKILELLGDDELRGRFSKNALETGKKYDWDVIGREYEKIIKDGVIL